MQNKYFKLFLKTSGIVFLLLVVALAVHIYIVTRPKPLDKTQLAIARIDFKQSISPKDSLSITQWLYQQKGVQYVLCNPTSSITVFGFYPAQINANDVVTSLTKTLHYQAQRHIPTVEELNSGCPIIVATTGAKLYNYLKSRLN
ncbi:hypothetical protein ACFOW1_08765 [Parasediminibacterium paludis]|uniref:Heavy-metal-associated domain-containing protein n=1 Tax=Parasediminibacterium paludis TaxID=908966 RepID=A0ABV8PXL2_9BACT